MLDRCHHPHRRDYCRNLYLKHSQHPQLMMMIVSPALEGAENGRDIILGVSMNVQLTFESGSCHDYRRS